MIEALGVLWAWTPFLLGGLSLNVLIALGAMAIGTLIGGVLALARLSKMTWIARGGRGLTSLFQNIPSLVLLFYAASVIPHEIVLSSGTVVQFPAWLKACLALSGSPIGIVSDNGVKALTAWRSQEPRKALLFVPAWTMSFLITFLASSLASLIGVSELVGRCNVVIAATGTIYMAAIYFYASLIFLACAYPLTVFSRRLKNKLVLKYETA
jgi:polar amino acid transport system permease protein